MASKKQVRNAVTRYIEERDELNLLDETTPRNIREAVAVRLGLRVSELDTTEYRQLVTKSIGKFRKKDAGAKEVNTSGSSDVDSSLDENDQDVSEPEELEEVDRENAPPARSKGARSGSRPEKRQQQQPQHHQEKKSKKEYKSRSYIEDSDEEYPAQGRPSPRRDLAEALSKKRSDTLGDPEPQLSLQDAGKKRRTNDKDIKRDLDSSPPPRKKPKNHNHADRHPSKSTSSRKGNDSTDEKTFAQEMKGASKSKASSSSTRVKSKNTESSNTHEETLKRYKRLISACGVRKPYAKIFKEEGILDSPSRQVDCLRRILQGLGMKGRMSLEQAKKIRAKRELSEEMQDVVDFSSSLLVSGRASRSATRKQGTTEVEEPSDGNSDGGSDDVDSGKRKPSARRRIDAFLANQSDSD